MAAYAREVLAIPRLTGEAEFELAKQIDAGREAVKMLSAPHSATLEFRDKHELRKAAKRGRDANETLVTANLFLVLNYVNRHGSRLAESRDLWLDVIQEGNLGLMHAAEKFDLRHGVRFAPYAMFWIRQSITRSSHNITRQLALPTQVSDGIRRVRQAYEVACDGGKSRVSLGDLVYLSGLPPDRVLDLWEADAATSVDSLDEFADNSFHWEALGDVDQGIDMIFGSDLLSDWGCASVEDVVLRRELQREIRSVLAGGRVA